MPRAPHVPSLRLFLALWPDDATRAAIAAWQAGWRWPPGVKLVAGERLHLTLHFLGNVPAARKTELGRGLRVPFEPVELAFGTGSVWPGGIAVLRPQAVSEPLLGLHDRLAHALRSLELAVEDRAWRAHVTLARKASGAVPPPAGPALRWRADSGYVLVQSIGNGGGYRVLERFSPS